METSPSAHLTNIFGLGLRSPHYGHLETHTDIFAGWFEVISENYFRTRGRPRKMLETLRENFPISCHGVSLSIASYDDFDWKYLLDLKNFYQEIDPFLISDHLCFTGVKGNNLHNLLPFAYNRENLMHLSARIDQVQNFLGRRLAFENLSAYFDYKSSTMSEWEFISELTKITDCHLLLDLNNIFVNSYNHGFDPDVYLNAVPFEKVQELHLAGFSERDGFYFDTHSRPLYPELIELYKKVLKKRPDIPTLFEWDEDIPSFDVLENQIRTLSHIWETNCT
ncbi:MAG: MNIO family bufferin maturase [Bacteriovorax sp.]